MTRKLRYVLWFFLLGTGYAQIIAGVAPQGAASCTTTGGASNCTAPTTLDLNVQVGDTIIANISSNNTNTQPVLSGCSVSWPAPVRNFSSGTVQAIWIIAHTTTAVSACGVTVTGLAGTSAFALQIYRNVLSVGTPNIISTAVANTASFSAPQMTAAASGNVIVGIFSAQHTVTGAPYTAVSPAVLRRAVGASVGSVMADTTATSAGQQITVQAAANVVMAAYLRGAVELTPAPVDRNAQLADAMQTMLMNAPRNMSYKLDHATLSPTWCTWFMPISSSYTYKIDPTTTQVNGQTTPMTVPAWQMTRICQDSGGNFWASPPLLAGTGISITPSSTGLTIAASGTPGVSGMTYIAGGTTHIPGNVQVDPSTCTTLYTTTGSTTPSATGVEQSDVVSYSMQPLTPGWNSWRISFHAIAYDGSITWRACNSDTTAYTPAARDINWYVARASVSGFGASHRPAQKPARPKK